MPTASRLGLVVGLAPGWATLLAQSAADSVWLLAPPRLSGDTIPAIKIRIWIDDGDLTAAEPEPGHSLPAACPELHINPGGDFCLGAYAFRPNCPTEVSGFWQALGEFLHNQDFARRRGHWPAGRWLSHGKIAAEAQLRAEAAAAMMGIAPEYELWLEAKEGWLAGDLPVRNPKTRKLVIGRRPCPRGCRDPLNQPILLRNCTHRSAMLDLIDAEIERTAAHGSYFVELYRRGIRCCGRVEGCGLLSLEQAA